MKRFGPIVQSVRSLAKGALERFGVSALRSDRFEQLAQLPRDLEAVLRMPERHLIELAKWAPKTQSQNRADLFALSELGFKRDGYFVEFGAADGIKDSNTYLLEREFNWSGILAEPARCWHGGLKRNRSCHIDASCVWKWSDKSVAFSEAETPEESGIGSNNRAVKTYQVETISLSDLLSRHAAPRVIDFLSIDAEGSEYEILSNFDFSTYQFRVIACEHAYRPEREKISRLLEVSGYVRKFIGLSGWDDWYVKRR